MPKNPESESMKLPTLTHETRRSMAEDLIAFALGVEHYLHGPDGQRKSAASLSPIEQAADALVMVAKMTAVCLDPARMSTVRTADDAADSSFLTCTVCQEKASFSSWHSAASCTAFISRFGVPQTRPMRTGSF